MDGRTATIPGEVSPSGRKAKPKAPLPPSETKVTDYSLNDLELTNFSMEQKENIDRDIELFVVLPGEVKKTTTVNGSKPMMDLLVYLCAQYHLNPSSHTINLMSAEKKPITFKPNTPVGMLEVDHVILKPKQMDKKKPIPIIPEQTVRVVVNYKKTQKTIVRVSPYAPLQEIAQIICSKCDFDPLHTVLLKTYQSQETLDLTKSLNDLGLRELYAMDASRASCRDPDELRSSWKSLKENRVFCIELEVHANGRSKMSIQQQQQAQAQAQPGQAPPPLPPQMAHLPQQPQLQPPPVVQHPGAFGDSGQKSQNSDNLKEKENKGFLSIFQRSKKKRQQTASAPVTPLMNKPRPAFSVRSSSVSKQYDSNTLPSEMPKKRRAPLPPMPASQSEPQDLTQSHHRPEICVVKSSSVDEADKRISGRGIVRTGSLNLSGSSSANSSLKRTKRKAPSPPPRKLENQSDNSIETGSESAESIHKEGTGRGGYSEVQFPTGNAVDLTRTPEEAHTSSRLEPTSHDQNHVQQTSDEGRCLVTTDTPNESEVSQKSDLGSEYSLEEIDEKEEMYDGCVSPSLSLPDVPQDMQKYESASNPSTGNGDNTQEEKTENMNTDDKAHHSQILIENVRVHSGISLGTLQLNAKSGHNEATSPLMTEKSKLCVVEERENNRFQPLDLEAYKHDTSLNEEHSPQELLSVHDRKCNQVNAEAIKTQDVAIQATPSEDTLDQTSLNENNNPQDHRQGTHSNSTHEYKSGQENHPLAALNGMNQTVEPLMEFNHQKPQGTHNSVNPNRDHDNVFFSDYHVLPERIVSSPVSLPTKMYPLYQQGSKPRPKPSNEITRDYIPKVGMTTYKIVPPKLLEVVKSWESDTAETREATIAAKNENSQEFGTQTESTNISKSLNHTEPDFTNEIILHGVRDDPLGKTYSVADHTTVSFSDARGKKTAEEHSKPNPHHLTAPLTLNPGSKGSPPAVQEKPRMFSPSAKPSNFYLQMQRRASDHYITSAIARSASLNQNEAKSIETEKKLESPDQPNFLFPGTVTGLSQFPEKITENGRNEETKVTTSPEKVLKPLNSPSSQPSPLNLKTLRTFVLPKPYSCSKPSPFALAVSSAVKRSQSFSKMCPSTSKQLKEQSSLDLSSSVSNAEIKDHPPVPSPTAQMQQSLTDKQENNNASYEQNRQIPTLFSYPATLQGRSIATAVQQPDPEQIHQSLLAAIRSGEAAAKLRRVAPPSNTVAINGKSSLNSSVPIEASYNSR